MSETAEGELNPNDIAIVGMSGRFPGCRNVEEYWQALYDGRECIQPYSDEELLEEVHQRIDLDLGALPVLLAECVEGQRVDAEPPARAHGAAHGLAALAMTEGAEQALLLSPASVAIHDDGDVPGQTAQVDTGHVGRLPRGPASIERTAVNRRRRGANGRMRTPTVRIYCDTLANRIRSPGWSASTWSRPSTTRPKAV